MRVVFVTVDFYLVSGRDIRSFLARMELRGGLLGKKCIGFEPQAFHGQRKGTVMILNSSI